MEKLYANNNYELLINNLKEHIKATYQKTYNKLSSNIYRGHLRSISTDIEDGIALLISALLPECKVFLDPSIKVAKKNNRPDILVVNDQNEVVSMIEIKANMGWCRNAACVIDNMINNDTKFKNEQVLNCEFSREDKQKIFYGNNVKLFLISFTDANCSLKKHRENRLYAKNKNVLQLNLFSGWYDALSNGEIIDFINYLIK